MKKVTIIVVSVVFGLFFASLGALPEIGDPGSAPNSHITPYYIEHSERDTGSPNIVTGTLADYRGFDTLEETTVMFLAGMTAVMILRLGSRDTSGDGENNYDNISVAEDYDIKKKKGRDKVKEDAEK